MSDILTIDTTAGIVQEERIDPLPLYDENHPMLKIKINEYTSDFPNRALETLAKRLRMTMKLYAGLGLSANQCGVLERMFVIGTEHFQITCLNPTVIDASSTLRRDKEGCLSFPGMFLNVERQDWIDVQFLTEHGEGKQMRLEGLTARCFLHELDHLNGIRFVDHVKPLALKMAREKQQKLIKKAKRKAK